ncbi:DUF3306 domain-containing protein [Vibrio amylolyticus]|uniref:DUF3306 domain-containing protein n=1 Tax=Vibrio amylolyticus TaxID=2847292 RepID=UPI00354D04BA
MANLSNKGAKSVAEQGVQVANSFLNRWSNRKLTGNAEELDTDRDCTAGQGTDANVSIELSGVDKQVGQRLETCTEDGSNVTEPIETERLYDESVNDEVVNSEEAKSQDISEDSSVASMLTSDVDPLIKKAALRKLFLSEEFNQLDGLNDYDQDFSAVQSLSSEVAQTLREWTKSSNSEVENVTDSDIDTEQAILSESPSTASTSAATMDTEDSSEEELASATDIETADNTDSNSHSTI